MILADMLMTAIVYIVLGVILVGHIPMENYLEASVGMVFPMEKC